MMQLFSDEVRFWFFSMHVFDGKSANRYFENVLAILVIINKQIFFKEKLPLTVSFNKDKWPFM